MKKYFTNMVISAVKPNVPKTKIQKGIRDLKISTQKSKAGKAKLDQTIFELKQNKDFTFARSKKKTESNTEKYKAKKRNEESKKIFKTVKGEK